MSTFEQLRDSQDVPYVVVAQPTIWKDTYRKRPHEPVAIGIRSLGLDDYEKARVEGAKWVHRECGDADTETKIAALTTRMQIWAIGAACCDPNNIYASYFPSLDEEVNRAIRPEGLRFLYDEIEKLHIAENPMAQQADLEDLRNLAALITVKGNPFEGMSAPHERQCRCLLRHVLDKMALAAVERSKAPASVTPPMPSAIASR